MRSHEAIMSVSPVAPFSDARTSPETEIKSDANSNGETIMEPRFTELETHLKYIRRDMDEVRGDVKAIKYRLAYAAGATAVVITLLGWIANSRFDQVVALISR
ncbi:hypothetical protein [Pseudomonas sp. BW7P1]|uniref:hypothetical protein n=1 Tax=Pseudomonas TaxID=286 RepID=UPI0021ADC9CC|nr:hypothetical protein [Pseudomonas sp. BW7P1]UWI64506.1 hypothetical protein NWV16_19630 [Pseudomonas sp. BW7P1]